MYYIVRFHQVIIFTDTYIYNIYVDNIGCHKVKFVAGSYGGGQILTVQGTGFDPLKTNVTVCSANCKLVGQPSPTQLMCEVPENSGNQDIIHTISTSN